MLKAEPIIYPSLSHHLASTLADLPYILPEIFIAILLLVVLVLDLCLRQYKTYLLHTLLLAGLLFIFYSTTQVWKNHQSQACLYLFNQLLLLDPLAIFFKLLFIIATLFTLLISGTASKAKHIVSASAEYLIFVLAVLLGACLLVMANSLMTLYLSIELIAIASYLLVYFNFTQQSVEASLKYILYGITVSAIMLWGMSYLYGFTGTLYLNDPNFVKGIQEIPSTMLLFIIFLAVSGILFKMSLVPYHFWAPDVYQSAPTAVISYLSVVPKLAAAVVMLRFVHKLAPVSSTMKLQDLIALMAMLTISLGNVSALLQKNAKRMMAYSSIAQAGFILATLVTHITSGVDSFLFYGVIYAIMNFTVFTAIKLVHAMTGSEAMQAYTGLGRRFPVLGVCITIVMLSLIGLPPTAGFTGKLLIFSSLWDSFQQTHNPLLLVLFVIAILNTVVSLFYYMKIPYLMFFKAVLYRTVPPALTWSAMGIILFLTLFLLLIFFQPNLLMGLLSNFKFVL